MHTLTVSSKGQVTLPADFRRDAGIAPGKKLHARVEGKTLVLQLAPDFFAMKGCLGKAKPLEVERDGAEREAVRRSSRKDAS